MKDLIAIDLRGIRAQGQRRSLAQLSGQERSGVPTRSQARGGMIFFAVALFAALFLNSASIASEVPALNATINDFAGMMPQASIHDLEVRLARFRTETSHPVVIVTVKSLDGESIDSFGRRTFKNLPFASADLEKAVLLVVARKE